MVWHKDFTALLKKMGGGDACHLLKQQRNLAPRVARRHATGAVFQSAFQHGLADDFEYCRMRFMYQYRIVQSPLKVTSFQRHTEE